MSNITRIVFEPLADGRFRWRLFAGDRLNHDELSHPGTIDEMFAITRMLCTGGAEDAKEETYPRAGTEGETDPLAGGLDRSN